MLSESVTLGSDPSWRVGGWAHFSGCQALSPLMNPGARGRGGLARTPATGRWLITGGVVFSFAPISTDLPLWQPQSPGGHLNQALSHLMPQPPAVFIVQFVCTGLYSGKSQLENACEMKNNCAFGSLRCITPTQTWNNNKPVVFHIQEQLRRI